MLVLTRKPGESILIGKDIEIAVLEVDGKIVRFGITAPKHLDVLRHELLQRGQPERSDSAAELAP